MKCQDFRELIDSYLSDELLTETNHGVLRHLEQCAACRQVIEERRMFRARLRSAVMNCEEFEINRTFEAGLRASLRASAVPPRRAKVSFWNLRLAFAAAAGLLVVFSLGFLLFQNFGSGSGRDVVGVREANPAGYFQQIALADHKMCAVEHKLSNESLQIDLTSASHASLQRGVVAPLANAADKYELIASHFCDLENQNFTHLIYRHEGNTMSVLITDLPDDAARRTDYINRLSLEGYQIAQFDVDKKAVFVISDMPERQNAIAAEILEQPLRRELSVDMGFRISDFGFTIPNPQS